MTISTQLGSTSYKAKYKTWSTSSAQLGKNHNDQLHHTTICTNIKFYHCKSCKQVSHVKPGSSSHYLLCLLTVHRSRSPSPTQRSTGRSRVRGEKNTKSHVRSQSMGDHSNSDTRLVALRLENTERKLGETQRLLHLKVALNHTIILGFPTSFFRIT